MAAKPTSLDIRAYNIGFGDCFLLTFHYGKDDRRHMLIDFGTTRKPDNADSDHELNIAKDIAAVTENKLDVIVATHRHKDHISGFATRKKAGDAEKSGDVIRECAKDAVVIMPWTEDPEAAVDATGPTKKKAFVQQLGSMHTFAEAVVREIEQDEEDDLFADADVNDPTELAASTGPKQRMHREESDDAEGGTWFSTGTLRKRLRFIGEDAISNVSAVRNLVTMSRKEKRHYVSYDYKLDLRTALPGVKVKVLGPPNVDQWPSVQKQASKNKAEYWHLQADFWRRMALNSTSSVSAGRAKPLFPRAAQCEPEERCSHRKACPQIPRASEWFVRRLRGVRAKQLMQLVLSMDNALNNTSVILLLEVGGKKLLFPGDAQWENWEFALKESKKAAEHLKELADVDVYKVGHHGSLNATPKTLWNNFTKRSDDPKAKSRMLSIISTKKGVHAHSPQTAVPRSTLVRELKSETNYRSTEPVKPTELCLVETIDL
jgi:hypothetical protein